MKRVFRTSDTIAQRAREATKRALEAKAPGERITQRQVDEVTGLSPGDGKPRKIGRPLGAKNKVKKPTKLVRNCSGNEAGKGSGKVIGEKTKQLRPRDLPDARAVGAGKSDLGRSVSSAIGPDAMAEWDRQLAELCVETIKGAPKKLLLQKPSDLKLVDDLMRRANGVAGANAGADRGPGHLVQINFLDSVGKERPENIRVVTSPFPQDDDA